MGLLYLYAWEKGVGELKVPKTFEYCRIYPRNGKLQHEFEKQKDGFVPHRSLGWP